VRLRPGNRTIFDGIQVSDARFRPWVFATAGGARGGSGKNRGGGERGGGGGWGGGEKGGGGNRGGGWGGGGGKEGGKGGGGGGGGWKGGRGGGGEGKGGGGVGGGGGSPNGKVYFKPQSWEQRSNWRRRVHQRKVSLLANCARYLQVRKK